MIVQHCCYQYIEMKAEDAGESYLITILGLAQYYLSKT